MRAFVIAVLTIAAGGCSGGASSTPDGGDSDDPDTGDSDADGGLPPGSLIWAQHIGGSDYVGGGAWVAANQGHSVAALSDGTFYVGGTFVNFAVFGAGTENEATLQAAGDAWDADAFVGRWQPDGVPQWVLGIGGEEPGSEYVDFPYDSLSDLGTLPDDSAFLRLRLENGADLDPMGDQPVVPDDDADPPAARYRSDGRLFAHFEPGLGGAASGFGVAYQDFSRFFVWPDGSFAISDGGSIIETLTLGEGEPNETSLVPDPEGIGMDVVAVFNADGTLRWAVKLENGDPWLTAQVVELGIDPDGSVIAVVYAAFGTDGAEALIGSSDGTVASATFVEYPNVDATAELLVKWDSEGVLEWVKQIPKIYEPSPLLVRNDGTIVLMDDYLDGVAFDPGGPGEAVIDHGDCDQQFCFFAVEIAPDASSFTPHLLEGGGDHIAMRQDGSFALADGCSVMAYSADYELEWTATIKPDSSGGVWIHDIATLAGGSLVVTGDYSYGATFGAGELNETTLHGVCDECQYGAFLARYAW